MRDGGVSAIVGKFYYLDNGRVMNAVLVWCYARFGVAGHQWFGLISGVLMLGLLWAAVAGVLPRAGMTVPRGVPLLLASMVTAMFLFGSPNTYKTFYWPAASVSHTLPPVFACAAALPLLRATSRWGRGIALLAVFLAGFFMGTLSEETCVVGVVVLSCLLLISGRIVPQERRTFFRGWCVAGITGIVIGSLILLNSPGSRHRRERHHASSILTPESLLASLRGFAHIAAIILTTWQYLGAFVAGLLLGLLARQHEGRLPPMRHGTLLARTGVCALLVSGYLCTVITYPAFGSTVATSTRLWNDYLLLYILLLVLVGALLGRAWRERGRPTGPPKAVAATVYAFACLSLAVSLVHLGTDMAVRARKWDDQDHWLRSQSAAGAKVLPYTRLPISKMTEPFADDGRKAWPASCVAHYYHLERVVQATGLP
ncbi:DUF6056 family protein [Streptomyces sp. NPDC048411]|uniref:DUF6056 family protein n=1 Tax=Streptomyces sp. NPDC048411 TaxID=3157206 RepID=UPI003452DCCF